MAKQELKWTTVQATSLTGDMLKAWDALQKAQTTFKTSIVEAARKGKHLNDGETLAIACKPWGFMMAKADTKLAQATAKAGALFSNL